MSGLQVVLSFPRKTSYDFGGENGFTIVRGEEIILESNPLLLQGSLVGQPTAEPETGRGNAKLSQ